MTKYDIKVGYEQRWSVCLRNFGLYLPTLSLIQTFKKSLQMTITLKSLKTKTFTIIAKHIC